MERKLSHPGMFIHPKLESHLLIRAYVTQPCGTLQGVGGGLADVTSTRENSPRVVRGVVDYSQQEMQVNELVQSQKTLNSNQ